MNKRKILYEDCYVEITLTAKDREMFVDGKIVLVKTTPTITAVLHERQANNTAKVDIIKRLMWEDLAKANNWQVTQNPNINTLCNTTLRAIPKKSKPITYKI